MSEDRKPFTIGLVGLGTVGVGVIKMLEQNADIIAQRSGRSIQIKAVSASNKSKDRGVNLSPYEWVDDGRDMAAIDDLDCIVEMVGGSEGFAKELVEKVLQSGKHVVTANKALLAEHRLKLAQIAEENNICLMYEAAVAGGIPIIKNLREGLAGNQIDHVYGILNGTCNYILTEMRETGRDFADVLQEAQEKGYSEADPTFDVDGIDAAHKLVLLGALAFGVEPDFKNLTIEGIRNITADDIQYADELGYRIKLLGVAHHQDESFIQIMAPCLVSKKSAIGNVEGVFNAVLTHGDFVDQTMMEGRGAGERPTASSVVADLIDLAKGVKTPVFNVPVSALKKAQWQGPETLEAKCYIHLHTKDDAGVLADVTTCLKDHGLSIKSVIQRGHDGAQTASIVILTHRASFMDAQNCVQSLKDKSFILQEPLLLRVEDI